FLMLPNAVPDAQRKDANEKVRDLTHRAADLVKPGDREFDEIHLRWAEMLLQDFNRDEARKQIDMVLQKQPYNHRARIMMASVLKNEDLPRAIALLEEVPPPDPDMIGFRASLKPQREVERL